MVIAILAYLAGKAIKPTDPATGMLPQTPLAADVPADAPVPVRGPDISRLSPRERAERLYRRVVLLAAQGKSDSVLFFAPMAIDAYAMLSPLDSGQRSEVGEIQTALADAQRTAARREN